MKRNKLIATMASICVSCAAFAGATAIANNVASAADEQATVNVSTILMKEGASVRVNSTSDSYKGIRFTLYVNQAYYDSLTNPVVGVYVTGANLATEADMKAGNIPTDARHYSTAVKTELTGDDVQTIEDTYSFNAVVYGIPDTKYLVDMIANGYIYDDTNTTKTYATNPQTRSIAEVASLALADGDTRDGLTDYVDKTITDDNFVMENASITTDYYKTEEPSLGLTTPSDKLKVIWTNENNEIVEVAEDGTLTRGDSGTLGTTTLTAKLGTHTLSANVTLREPVIADIEDEASSKVINNTDVACSFVPAADLTTITGDYEDNARRMSNANNNGYKVENAYTVAELEKIAEDYNYVTLWFAATGVGSNDGDKVYLWNGNYFSDKVFSSWDSNAPGRYYVTKSDCGVWQKWQVAIGDYISLVELSETNGNDYITLFSSSGNTYNTEDTSVYFYIGNIEFDFVVNPYILQVTSSTATNRVGYYDGWSASNSTYVASDADELSGFTGGYTGAAMRFKAQTSGSANGYRFGDANTEYTEKMIATLKEDYNAVSMWIAVDNIASGTFTMQANTTTRSFFQQAAEDGAKTVLNADSNKKWVKWSVGIDEYLSMLTTFYNTGNKVVNSSYLACYIMAALPSSVAATDGSTIYFYFGDIYFDNI